MNNSTGIIFLIIWITVCIGLVFRTTTFQKAWKVGFLTSWIGLISISFIVGAFMSAQGGMGLHGLFAIFIGWVPCLAGAFIVAGSKILIEKLKVPDRQDKKK